MKIGGTGVSPVQYRNYGGRCPPDIL